jgi:RNA polymerase sigma-70 factor (ECF subfamily)
MGRKHMSICDMRQISFAARGNDARESVGRDRRSQAVHHDDRDTTHHKATFGTLCVKTSSPRRKMVIINAVWRIVEAKSRIPEWCFLPGGHGAVAGGAGNTPKTAAIGPLLMNRRGVCMTDPTPADGGIRQGQVARLLMKHRTSLYGFIFACVRNHDDTEDILQNVSVAVTESIGQLKDESGFLPWAREIARRRVLAHRRSARRDLVCDPEVARALAEASDRVEREQPASAHRAALMACLEGLPGESRRLIQMRYDREFGDVADIARQLGRTVQSVYAQLKRIKIALRECVSRRLAVEQA